MENLRETFIIRLRYTPLPLPTLKLLRKLHWFSLVYKSMYVCIHMCISMYATAHVWRLGDYLWESVLSPHESWQWNSDCSAWRKVPLPAGPSHQPLLYLKNIFIMVIWSRAKTVTHTSHKQETRVSLPMSREIYTSC